MSGIRQGLEKIVIDRNQLVLALEGIVDDVFVYPREISGEIRNWIFSGRLGSGFHGLLQHVIACGFGIDLLMAVTSQNRSNLLGRLQNILVQRLATSVFVVKPKSVACHETFSTSVVRRNVLLPSWMQ